MRQSIQYNPEVKEFEAYLDFSGGLNSEISNERLKDSECPVLENVDLSARGSLKRRSGRDLVASKEGKSQGMFFYYRSTQEEPDLIVAISGRLYVESSGSLVEIPITDDGSAFTFQDTKNIEAVQYGDDLFIATGTKLVELTYDSGWVAKTVTPYTPSVMEAIYIGTNGLADNPDAYIEDGESTSLAVVGIKPNNPSGAVNTVTTMTAFISKPTSITAVDYKWEYKKSVESTWVVGRDWTGGASGKSWDFNPTSTSNYDIRVTVRDNAAQTTTAQYVMADYVVNPTQDTSTIHPVDGIQTCRGILLHWDRILLYRDSSHPYQMYISDLLNPRYFPMTNTINFDAGRQEPITSVVRFQNMLVVFTTTTIQTLLNKSPQTYERYDIHSGVGCDAEWSARVVGNVIIFKSEEGIHQLRPNPFRLETMNVKRIDYQIKSQVPADKNACALVYDDQYWICFPDKKVIYRYYYEEEVWAKDVSDKLDIVRFAKYGDSVYNLTANGSILKHNKNVYNDSGTVYDMNVETKFLDLSASFNYKKLKRLYTLGEHFMSHNTELKVTVQADSAITLTPDSGQAVVDVDGSVTWVSKSEPNLKFYAGTVFGSWIVGISPFGFLNLSAQRTRIRGKCRRVKLMINHKQDAACIIYGFGLEFKLKKP